MTCAYETCFLIGKSLNRMYPLLRILKMYSSANHCSIFTRMTHNCRLTKLPKLTQLHRQVTSIAKPSLTGSWTCSHRQCGSPKLTGCYPIPYGIFLFLIFLCLSLSKRNRESCHSLILSTKVAPQVSSPGLRNDWSRLPCPLRDLRHRLNENVMTLQMSLHINIIVPAQTVSFINHYHLSQHNIQLVPLPLHPMVLAPVLFPRHTCIVVSKLIIKQLSLIHRNLLFREVLHASNDVACLPRTHGSQRIGVQLIHEQSPQRLPLHRHSPWVSWNSPSIFLILTTRQRMKRDF